MLSVDGTGVLIIDQSSKPQDETSVAVILAAVDDQPGLRKPHSEFMMNVFPCAQMC